MSRRRGFTLVELLVVAGIFAMLFGLVLSGSRPSTNNQVRQAAQSLASVLLAAQSRALGNPAGAGVMLDPAGSFLPGTAVATVSAADMLPMITGICTGTTFPPSNLSDTFATVGIQPDNADPADLANGYKIRFQQRDVAGVQSLSPWMAYATGTVSFRVGNGQTGGTNGNTIWPRPLAGGVFSVWVARYPNKAESLYEMPKGAAIDLRYSGVGDGGMFGAAWSQLDGKGAIALVFDSLGEVDVLMQQVLGAAASRPQQPLVPVSPLYLLVASRTDIEDDRALATARSLWVVVHPQTGRVSVSSNVPQSSVNATTLRAARAGARQGLAIGK
jgi:prepilin-type N-terminal cleavage/methylation domain-containing protein